MMTTMAMISTVNVRPLVVHPHNPAVSQLADASTRTGAGMSVETCTSADQGASFVRKWSEGFALAGM
jgi:hypothetical protein